MSLVGILGNKTADVEVIALHVNFWALSTPFTPLGICEIARRLGTRKAFIDIGIRFRVAKGSLGGLRLLLPPDAIIDKTMVDLSPLVLDETINDLIFGVVTKSSEGKVFYPLGDKDVVDKVVCVTKAESSNSGIIGLTFSQNIVGSENLDSYYVRVRFECKGNSSLLNSKDWAFAKQGFVFRCLINDVRATFEMRNDPRVAATLLPIDASFVFLIAPSDFIPALVSPSLHYSRLLEASIWQSYLKSCGAVLPSHKYTIHQWRSLSKITAKQPFRAYMHLHREFGLGVRLTYLIGLATIPTLSAAYGLAKYFGIWPGWWPTF